MSAAKGFANGQPERAAGARTLAVGRPGRPAGRPGRPATAAAAGRDREIAIDRAIESRQDRSGAT